MWLIVLVLAYFIVEDVVHERRRLRRREGGCLDDEQGRMPKPHETGSCLVEVVKDHGARLPARNLGASLRRQDGTSTNLE